jgi:hypothetical protein
MQTLLCGNCGSVTGFKRAWGFGTLVMIVLTLGLWLMVLPLYPAHCIRCGLDRTSASSDDRVRHLFIVSLSIFVLAVIFVIARSRSGSSRGGTQLTGAESETKSASPLETVEARQTTTMLTGTDLLKDYEDNETSTEMSLKGSRIVLTGRLVQVFVPSDEQSMDMARRGYQANSILMIDSAPVPPSRPAEALFTPGIAAHSESRSFFGYPSASESQLQSNRLVTVSCESASHSRISEMTGRPKSMFGDIAVSLFDCILVKRTMPRSVVTPKDDFDMSRARQAQEPAPIEREAPGQAFGAQDPQPK